MRTDIISSYITAKQKTAETDVSTDRLTSEQRKGIHDRARKIGYFEGVRSGVNQLASYLGPEVGKVTLSALSIVLDSTDEYPPQRVHFESVDWQRLGATTLGDLQLLTQEELVATHSDPKDGAVFAKAIADALAVFNIQQ